MSAKLELEGFAEFREALRHLPEQLKAEAATIVIAAAEEAKRDVVAAYPQGPTGNLKRGVSTAVEANSRAGVVARVKSNARHAYIFEHGTVPRRTRSGANRGQMPPAPPNEAAIPIFIRARRKMQAALIEMVQKAGLVVTQS